jgi:hypothetical protein
VFLYQVFRSPLCNCEFPTGNHTSHRVRHHVLKISFIFVVPSGALHPTVAIVAIYPSLPALFVSPFPESLALSLPVPSNQLYASCAQAPPPAIFPLFVFAHLSLPLPPPVRPVGVPRHSVIPRYCWMTLVIALSQAGFSPFRLSAV